MRASIYTGLYYIRVQKLLSDVNKQLDAHAELAHLVVATYI